MRPPVLYVASSYSYICVRILIHVSSSYARVRAYRSEGEHEALSYWLLEHVAISIWRYCLFFCVCAEKNKKIKGSSALRYCLLGPLILVYVLVLVALLLFLLLCIMVERVTEL